MDSQEIALRLEAIESMLKQLLAGRPSIPESFLPGGVDWRLSVSDEEARAFSRARGQERRKMKPKSRKVTI